MSGNPTLRGDWQFRYCNYGASFNQTYNHDDVNRLCTVRETNSTAPLAPRPCGDAWYQSYLFDRWGNMAVKATPGVTPHPLTVNLLSFYNTANNRLSGGNWAYDAAGNLITHGGWTLTYDAASRMKTSQPSGGSATSYAYDAHGRRVKKTTGAASTYFVYDAFGQLAAEYVSTDPTGATETQYLTTDHLGSTRLVTNQSGAVISRHDYLPFGWELCLGLNGRAGGHGYLTSPEGVATPAQRFTGKERDTETRLDYFGARYYSAGPGRFTSADPKLSSGRPDDPQTWNRYTYVTNNPLRLIDPDGRDKWEAFLQSARAWWDEMWRPAVGMTSGSVEPPSGNTPSGPGFDNSQVVRRHAEEVGKGATLLKDITMLADVSGAGGILEAGMQRDGTGTVLAMGLAAIPGGRRGANVALSEAKRLVGGWSTNTSFGTKVGKSIAYHFERHGADVGASDVWQYLRKAEGFAANLKGATKKPLEEGKTRYIKNGRYIILDEDKNIVSFGLENR